MIYGLTARQADILMFIDTFMKRNGHSPSYREIAVGVGVSSPSNVHYIIKDLVKRGALHAIQGKWRTLVVDPGWKAGTKTAVGAGAKDEA